MVILAGSQPDFELTSLAPSAHMLELRRANESVEC
jgi:hypothetical protein